MSQNPQGSNPEDSDPEYNQLNEQLAEPSAQDGQDTSGQPMMLPADTVQKIIERIEGERAAQTSLVLGLVSLVCLGLLPVCLLSSWAISVCLEQRKRSACAFRL